MKNAREIHTAMEQFHAKKDQRNALKAITQRSTVCNAKLDMELMISLENAMNASKGITVLCTFLLDVIVFKDKVTYKKLIGLAMVMVAIVLVTL